VGDETHLAFEEDELGLTSGWKTLLPISVPHICPDPVLATLLFFISE
jgi:hypothetical protein